MENKFCKSMLLLFFFCFAFYSRAGAFEDAKQAIDLGSEQTPLAALDVLPGVNSAQSYLTLEDKKKLKEQAQEGDVNAMVSLGYLYKALFKQNMNDNDSKKYLAKSVNYFACASNRSDMADYYDQMQYLDLESNINYKGLIEYFHSKAQAGDPLAQFYLGFLYFRGHGNPELNPEEGMKWLTSAAEQGQEAAMMVAGQLYQSGYFTSIPLDCERSERYFNHLADKGIVRAYYWLGVLNTRGWEGRPADVEKAKNFFMKVLENNTIQEPVHECLALIYHNGWEGQKPDIDEALKYYNTKIEIGPGHFVQPFNIDVNAMLRLIDKYGYNEEQPNRLFSWLESLATTHQDVDAMMVLATLYHNTELLDIRREDKAIHWFAEAANLGSIAAAFELGALYTVEDGPNYNLDKAKHWLQIAAEKGHSGAQFFLNSLAY